MPDLVKNVLRYGYTRAFKFCQDQRPGVIAEYHEIKALGQSIQVECTLDRDEFGIDLYHLQQVNNPQLAHYFFRCSNDVALPQRIEDYDIAFRIFSEMQERLQG